MSRFRSGGDRVSPAAWFGAAAAFGLREDLEILAVISALSQLDRFPEEAFISLNVSPATVVQLDRHNVLGDVAGSRVVLEVAEEAVAEAADEAVTAALRTFRDRGVRLALDDTGSGLVSLRQLLDIRADLIKIDTDVTRGVDADVTKQAIAYALKSLAERSGALSVAEGVETEEEADMLASLGVEAAQGYLFGRPSEPD